MMRNTLRGWMTSAWNKRLMFVCLLTSVIVGCSLEGVVEVDNPEDGRQLDPNMVLTRAGGLGLFYQAISQLQIAVSEQSWRVGVFTDELTNTFSNGLWLEGDARQNRRGQDGQLAGLDAVRIYYSLQNARVHATQARAVLRSLKDSSLNAAIAGTYAVEGYSMLLLAENFCSGIPLTEVPFGGDIVYGRALSTTQVLSAAVAKFDSALTLPHDSTNITTLARVGMGRAYLSLGEYANAAKAVSDVDVDDAFYLEYTERVGPGQTRPSSAFWTAATTSSGTPDRERVEVVNREGENGMTWYSDPTQVDPRVPVTTITQDSQPTFPDVVRQQKFLTGAVKFPLARGIEALLIRAEYALAQGSANWVAPLNEARATVGLSSLTDPENTEARVKLLFQERAYWLYLEGVRLADYRRLVRQYGISSYLLYPVGEYLRSEGEVPVYGDAWVFAVPQAEYIDNYQYEGCSHVRP